MNGTSKTPIPLLFSEWGKVQKHNELGKNIFSIRKKNNFILKPLGILHILQNFWP